MNKQRDSKQFTEIMMGVAEMFGKELSKPALRMWFEMLKEYDIADIQVAASKAIRTATFMPRPAELIDKMPGAETQALIANKADLECDKILGHMKYHGGSTVPEFDDPITEWLMSRRWPYKQWASNVTEESLKWWPRDFKQAYISYQAATEGDPNRMIDVDPEVKGLLENIGKNPKEVDDV